MSVLNDGILGQPAAVRVECEAIDCGALLEVEVPNQHNSSTPLIVRCGNCNRLLEVWLHMPTSDRSQGVATLPPPCQTTKVPDSHIRPSTTRAPAVKRRHTAPADGSHGNQGYTPLLVRPPPLSRFTVDPTKKDQIGQYFGKSNSMMETSLDQFGIHSIIRSDSAFPPQIWGDARGGRTEGIFPAMENFSSIHGHEENGYGVKGRAKKSKKSRNPSPYNLYMSEEVKRIKAEHPTVDHKQAFKMAARHWAKSPHDCRKNSSLSSCNFSRLLPGAPAKTPPVPLPVPLVSLNDAVPVGNGIKRVLERVSSLPALVTAPKEPPPGFRAQILESGGPETFTGTRRSPDPGVVPESKKESYPIEQVKPADILALDESSRPQLEFGSDFQSSHLKNASPSSPEILVSSLALDTTPFLDSGNDTALPTP